ncbi:hypothetical protein LguiA_005668 [Lonicera macranthoides]
MSPKTNNQPSILSLLKFQPRTAATYRTLTSLTDPPTSNPLRLSIFYLYRNKHTQI